MYRDVLQPGDTFPMMMRKMVMAIGAIIGIVPIIVVIQVIMGLTEKDSSTLPRFISLVVIMIGPWIYVKWTHTAPTWLIAFWTNSMSLFALVNIMSSPNAPYEFALIGVMMVVLLCKVPSMNLTVPFVVLLVFAYNFSLGRMGAPYPLMMLPDGSDDTPDDLVFSYIQCIAALLVSLYAVHLQTEEFTRTSLAATAANEMSLEVLQKLALYDTDGARAVLAAYASRGQVNGALMTSFGLIVLNLEEYRPHGPRRIHRGEQSKTLPPTNQSFSMNGMRSPDSGNYSPANA